MQDNVSVMNIKGVRFMKYLLIIFCLLCTSSGWSEDVCMDYLEDRKGVFYEKFKDVPFTGQYLSCYENGQLKVKSNYKDGKSEGEYFLYYKSGQIQFKNNYKDNKPEGEQLSYYENGQLEFKGIYKKGKMEGEWLSYSENGQLIETFIYKNGKLVDTITPVEH